MNYEEMFNEKLFDNITLSKLFKEIHQKINNKNSQIESIIKNIIELSQGNNTASLALLPTISDLLDVNVKNNDQLLKLATVVQRIMTNQRVQGDLDSDFDISDAEREALKKLQSESSHIPKLDEIKKIIGMQNKEKEEDG